VAIDQRLWEEASEEFPVSSDLEILLSSVACRIESVSDLLDGEGVTKFFCENRVEIWVDWNLFFEKPDDPDPVRVGASEVSWRVGADSGDLRLNGRPISGTVEIADKARAGVNWIVRGDAEVGGYSFVSRQENVLSGLLPAPSPE
jgi:hypothetical protein